MSVTGETPALAAMASDPYMRIIHATRWDASKPPINEFRLASATAEMLAARWLYYEIGTRPRLAPTSLMGVPLVLDDSVPLDRLRVRRADGEDTDVPLPFTFTD